MAERMDDAAAGSVYPRRNRTDLACEFDEALSRQENLAGNGRLRGREGLAHQPAADGQLPLDLDALLLLRDSKRPQLEASLLDIKGGQRSFIHGIAAEQSRGCLLDGR